VITIHYPCVSNLLAHLFADAQAVNARRETRGRPADSQVIPSANLPEYLAFYAQENTLYLEVAPETGRLDDVEIQSSWRSSLRTMVIRNAIASSLTLGSRRSLSRAEIHTSLSIVLLCDYYNAE
jgi:hypothetical protein